MLTELINCKVTPETRKRLKKVASLGNSTESHVIRVVLEFGLAIFELNPNIVTPLHNLLVKKNYKSILRLEYYFFF